MISLGEEVEEDIAQQTSHSEPQHVLEVLVRDGAVQLAGEEEEREEAGETDQDGAEEGRGPAGPVRRRLEVETRLGCRQSLVITISQQLRSSHDSESDITRSSLLFSMFY